MIKLVKKIRKIGTSEGVILPKVILNLWKSQEVNIYFDKDKIIITPHNEAEGKNEFN